MTSEQAEVVSALLMCRLYFGRLWACFPTTPGTTLQNDVIQSKGSYYENNVCLYGSVNGSFSENW